MFTPQPGAAYFDTQTPRRHEQDLYPPSGSLAQRAPLLFGSGAGCQSPQMNSPAPVPFTNTGTSGANPLSGFPRPLNSQMRGGGMLSPPLGIPQQPLFSPPTGQLGAGRQAGGLRGALASQPPPPLPVVPAAQRDAGPPLESMLDLPPVNASAAASQPAAKAAAGFGAAGAVDFSEGKAGFWVTAFGFHGAAMLPVVLQELRPSGGDFMQHRLGSGSWIHVQLRSQADQMEALAKNGRVGLTRSGPTRPHVSACVCTLRVEEPPGEFETRGG